MCGLLGILGPGIIRDDLKMMRDLAHVSGLRGMDSTGILQGTVNKWRKELFVDKSTFDVAYWLYHHQQNEKGNKRILTDVSANMILMHVRAATLGSITKENAHPFVIGSEEKGLIGFHNGTLLDSKYRKDKDKTDSEQLYVDINERGLRTVIENMDKGSAFALVYYDRNTGEVTIIRNQMRSLYMAVNTKRSVLYYASERWMLEGCAERNQIPIGDILYFEPMRSYTFRPDEVITKEVPDWRSEKFSFKVEPPVAAPANVQSPAARVKTRVKVEEGKVVVENADNILSFRNKTTDLKSKTAEPIIVGKPNTADKRLNPNKIEHKNCKYCNKDLDLYEQFIAKRDGAAFVCAGCDTRMQEIKKANDEKSVSKNIVL